MAKAIYTGIGDKARKVKNLYIGVDGKARKVKKAYIGVNGVAKLFYSSGWVLGSEALSGTSTGQTSAISGYDAYTFNADTGVITLSGSKTSHALSTLKSNGNPVYTAVSSDGHTITLKRVTDSATTTTDAYYKEGSASSSSSWYDDGYYLSGKSSYTFNKSTGQYTVSGSKSGYVQNLYGTGTKIYISGGSSLKWYEVTDYDTSTDYYYSEGSFSYNGGSYAEYDTTYSGCTSYSFSRDSGYSVSGYNSFYWWEGDSVMQDFYELDGDTLVKKEYRGNGWQITVTEYRATPSRSSETSMEYKVTTYTQGTTKVNATSSTTYTVKTYTQTAAEE